MKSSIHKGLIIMKTKIRFVILIIFILLTVCGCGKFIFSDYNPGDMIESCLDGNFYKLNSKFVMFDDGGFLKDNIVRINSSEENSDKTAGDYYNDGTSYYSAVIDKVYCSEDFIVATLTNDNKVIVIDCNEKNKKSAIHKYSSLDKVELDLNDYTLIECTYY